MTRQASTLLFTLLAASTASVSASASDPKLPFNSFTHPIPSQAKRDESKAIFSSAFTHPDSGPNSLPSLFKRQTTSSSSTSCDDAANIMRACAAAIPDYASASDMELAGCVCCDDGSWDASYFDSPVSSCVSFLEENYPEETEAAGAYAGIQGFCSVIGSVSCLPGSVTATAMATAAPTGTASADEAQITGAAGCSSASSMVEACSSVIPNMDDTTYEEVGACLCYNGKKWVPDEFDGYIDGCLDWASTAFPEYYSTIRDLDSFCSSIGPLTIKGDTPSTTAVDAATTATGLDGQSFTGLGASSTRTVEVAEATATDSAGNSISSIATRDRLTCLVVWVLGFYFLL